jgi:hypothetical protein
MSGRNLGGRKNELKQPEDQNHNGHENYGIAQEKLLQPTDKAIHRAPLNLISNNLSAFEEGLNGAVKTSLLLPIPSDFEAAVGIKPGLAP